MGADALSFIKYYDVYASHFSHLLFIWITNKITFSVGYQSQQVYYLAICYRDKIDNLLPWVALEKKPRY